jgi:hypothetical protein
MNEKYQFKGQPRSWYTVPLLSGIALMVLALLFWIFPRLLLFFFLFPIFALGLGLTLYGLDLWHGVPDWREKITRVRHHYWPGEEE